ncbi:hypothetical protein EC396_09015 [Lutibacter sp. HS1-25]|uniref:hypothetical protein n=1 Tax=Lutibacter sp. HS1-25 TaxID=2485000 RepID=UPI0010108DFF|nr:hypothetical protein [Lutibacter sp. HS1-25]RXP54515.1 hypothetical protein EC396_09015 [Lutibacter sp. HS1-25]
MKITHEEFQKARRISRAIQEHLEQINDDGLRSIDLYPILVRKKLIEKDKYNGLYFRRFLKKLKNNDLLKLIPQCKFDDVNPDYTKWHFYRVKVENKSNENKNVESKKLVIPKISESEIDELIKNAKPHIEKLPKINLNKLTLPQLETRKMYERAYEFWTKREIEIMRRAYKKFERIDKVAELLKRQPNVVEKKLNE